MGNSADQTFTSGSSLISIGRFTYGFDPNSVRQWNEGAALRIGAFCSIARNVTFFLGGNHRTDWITTFPFGHIYHNELGGEGIVGHPATKGDVIVGNDVWIGDGATIMSGVTIGDGAVIAAKACVVKNVMPYEIVGGNPARTLRQRFEPEIAALLLQLRWWELPVDAIRTIQQTLCAPPDMSTLLDLIAKYRVKRSPG